MGAENGTVRILLLGAPGAGKGTQGRRIAEHFGVRHISSGDLIRATIAEDAAAGAALRQYTERGELVPDEVVLGIVGPHVLEASREGGYVLDGFPRTAPQAEYARAAALTQDVHVQTALLLDVPHDELVERLHNRAQEEGRKDDTPEVIRRRLEVFDEHNDELVEFYERLGLLMRIDASGDVDAITKDILEQLSERHVIS
jgi:adenylate kinase